MAINAYRIIPGFPLFPFGPTSPGGPSCPGFPIFPERLEFKFLYYVVVTPFQDSIIAYLVFLAFPLDLFGLEARRDLAVLDDLRP